MVGFYVKVIGIVISNIHLVNCIFVSCRCSCRVCPCLNLRTQSLITADNEVPFAGEVSGVTVVNVDDGKRGLVEYNKPVGFVGGIEIRRLMARITLRYKFEVENYQLQGLKLLNVNNTIRLTNPSKNTTEDTYATLETVMKGDIKEVPDTTSPFVYP